MYVGIGEILENEAGETAGGDMVEFYLGASLVELEDDDIYTLKCGHGHHKDCLAKWILIPRYGEPYCPDICIPSRCTIVDSGLAGGVD